VMNALTAVSWRGIAWVRTKEKTDPPPWPSPTRGEGIVWASASGVSRARSSVPSASGRWAVSVRTSQQTIARRTV